MSSYTRMRLCDECGIDAVGVQRELRQLREKLEYSQLQNSLLVAECDKMRAALSEAEFKGRSSINAYTPLLPTEILQCIFFYATEMEGLALQPWNSDPLVVWRTNARTRHTIPLVCRQWYMVGLETLYEHVMVRNFSQISKLRDSFASLDQSIFVERIKWIRGFEIVMNDEPSESTEFADAAWFLLSKIPEGRLRKLAIDCGRGLMCGTRASSMLGAAITMGRSGLEFLHISCMRAQFPTNTVQSPGSDIEISIHENAQVMFPQLHTLSVTGGYWGICEGYTVASLERLVQHAKFIRTFSFDCSEENEASTVGSLTRLLQGAVHLESIHIVTNQRASMLINGLNSFLESVPFMKRLVITISPMWRFRGQAFHGVGTFVHHVLAEVTIHTELTAPYRVALILGNLFRKIKSGHLPNLKRLVITGSHPAGCLDAYQIYPADDHRFWLDSINSFAEHGIELVNDHGDPIHMWQSHHGIKVESVGVEDSTSASDDDDWYEQDISDLENFSPSDGTDSVTDDSEDAAYRYTPRPDLEWIYSDSDSEEREDAQHEEQEQEQEQEEQGQAQEEQEQDEDPWSITIDQQGLPYADHSTTHTVPSPPF